MDAAPAGEDARNPVIYERADAYPHIGEHGAERENGNVMHLRRFLEQTNYVALDTMKGYCSVSAYYDNGRGTRPDYTNE